VNHLVDDCVVNLLLGQIKPSAYAYPEIRILQLAVPLAVLVEGAHAKIGLGVGNSYRRFRELTVKNLPVKLPELFLNV
jgi:hypothetical protein